MDARLMLGICEDWEEKRKLANEIILKLDGRSKEYVKDVIDMVTYLAESNSEIHVRKIFSEQQEK